MSSFPAVTPLNQKIVDKIQDTSKTAFSGNNAFVTLTNFYSGKADTINYQSYTSANFDLSDVKNYKKRFPPVITGLSIGHSGNLGTIRKATVQLKFASMADLAANNAFFKIGNSQLVCWGWVKDAKNLPDAYDTAKKIILNIENWHKIISDYNHDVDFIAGILTNFKINVDSDASVNVELELSTPSEIPAYLSLNSTNKNGTVDSDSSSDSLTKICKALDFDGNLDGVSSAELALNTVNDKGWTGVPTRWFQSANSTGYIRLGFALEHICNADFKKDSGERKLQMQIDLSNSYCMAHPRIISASENVLFPNPQTVYFDDGMNAGTRVIKLNEGNTIAPFGPFNETWSFPEATCNVTVWSNGTKTTQTIDGYWAGKIENIFISTDFLIEASKGTKSVTDFIQKIIDELNIAGAGLYNLSLRSDYTDGNGKMCFSIIDLNFSSDNTPTLPTINLFPTNTNTRITNVDLNVDLPKEIIGQILLGDDANEMKNVGIQMFKGEPIDNVLLFADKKSTGTTDVVTSLPAGGSWPAQAMAFLGAIWDRLKVALNTPGQYREKFINDTVNGKKWFGAGPDAVHFGVFKDVSTLQTYYKKMGNTKILRNALVPITLKITVAGVAGVTLGSAINFNPSPVPWLSNGYWQVTNVEHTVQEGKWETIIEFKFRVGN
jgi:hypothetical protein